LVLGFSTDFCIIDSLITGVTISADGHACGFPDAQGPRGVFEHVIVTLMKPVECLINFRTRGVGRCHAHVLGVIAVFAKKNPVTLVRGPPVRGRCDDFRSESEFEFESVVKWRFQTRV
jgi:hypothetical protein